MRPDTATLVCSLIGALICVGVIYSWIYRAMRRKPQLTVKLTANTSKFDEGMRVLRSSIGDALILQRTETPCPDCKYGEPCEKCLGVTQ